MGTERKDASYFASTSKKNSVNSPLGQLHQEIKTTRKEILDMLELVLGEHPSWERIRSKILRAFGRQGLERHFISNGKEGYNGNKKEKNKTI